MTSHEKVLVVVAHPDDEVLGCGGTIAKLTRNGAQVFILIVAEGETSRGGTRHAESSAQVTAHLHVAAERSAKILGGQPPIMLGLPDNRLDSLPLLDVIKLIEGVIEDIAPQIVYTHHAGDLNIDHRIVHQAVMTACRPLPGSIVKRIATFETVSSTEWGIDHAAAVFRPNCFVNVIDTLDQKRQALETYVSEIRPFPHARSWENVESLARHRGASVGLHAAEAFMIVREISL